MGDEIEELSTDKYDTNSLKQFLDDLEKKVYEQENKHLPDVVKMQNEQFTEFNKVYSLVKMEMEKNIFLEKNLHILECQIEVLNQQMQYIQDVSTERKERELQLNESFKAEQNKIQTLVNEHCSSMADSASRFKNIHKNYDEQKILMDMKALTEEKQQLEEKMENAQEELESILKELSGRQHGQDALNLTIVLDGVSDSECMINYLKQCIKAVDDKVDQLSVE